PRASPLGGASRDRQRRACERPSSLRGDGARPSRALPRGRDRARRRHRAHGYAGPLRARAHPRRGARERRAARARADDHPAHRRGRRSSERRRGRRRCWCRGSALGGAAALRALRPARDARTCGDPLRHAVGVVGRPWWDARSRGRPGRLMKRRIRVLIADDSFIVRAGLREAVDALGGFDVVGEAASGNEAVALASERRPDIVLMDLRMPNGDGLAATERIAREVAAARTLVVSWSDDPAHVRDALYAGAKGYLVHGRFDPTELAAAMRALAEDDVSMTPIIATGIIAEAEATGAAAKLTKRELEIMRLVQRGRRNREIAREMGLEEKTVKNHLNNI